MLFARVVKLVDAGDSKSPAARRAGSIPAPGTISEKPFLLYAETAFLRLVWARSVTRVRTKTIVQRSGLPADTLSGMFRRNSVASDGIVEGGRVVQRLNVRESLPDERAVCHQLFEKRVSVPDQEFASGQ